MIEKIESCSPRRKWRPNLLKMGSWEPQENALRMEKKVERRPDRIPDVRYPGKVEPRRTRFRMWDIRRRWNVGRVEFRMWDIRVECRRRRIPDMSHPDGMVAEKNSECETSGWNGGGEGFQVWDIRMEWRWRRIPDVRHPDGMEAKKEFRVRDIRMEWRRRRIPDVRHSDKVERCYE